MTPRSVWRDPGAASGHATPYQIRMRYRGFRMEPLQKHGEGDTLR